jgi:hypothetical protein
MKAAHLYQWIPVATAGMPLAREGMAPAREGELLWLKYSFGPGTANSLALKLRDGTWLVISPPSESPNYIYDELDRQGGVSALFAPNAYHNRGQPAWRARFPNAVSYAPVGARSRLSTKTPGIEYRPFDELARILMPARILVPEGMKSPDVMFQIPATLGTVWWMGDQFSNSSVSDQIWPLRLLARFVGSGLGYRCNSKPELVYVQDRAAWLGSIRAALEKLPPTVVIPAHGDPVTKDAAARTLLAIKAVDTGSPNRMGV